MKIAFIGMGHMADAIFSVLEKKMGPDCFFLSNHNIEKLDRYKGRACFLSEDNKEVCYHADVVLICVKPFHLVQVCSEIAEAVSSRGVRPILVSLAAGVELSFYQRVLKGQVVVRAMPNMAAKVGAGVTAFYAEKDVSMRERDKVDQIFSFTGKTLWCTKESDLDIVTAVASSGLAYYFLMMEIMEKGLLDKGFEKKEARAIMVQVAKGLGAVVAECQDDFAYLRESITSRAGVTAAGLEVLEKYHFKNILDEAIACSIARAQEMAKEQNPGG